MERPAGLLACPDALVFDRADSGRGNLTGRNGWWLPIATAFCIAVSSVDQVRSVLAHKPKTVALPILRQGARIFVPVELD